MLICVTYQIPVSVYVETEDRSIYKIVVDDTAPMENGVVDGIETESFGWKDKLTEATMARLLRASEAIQAVCEDWPAWEIGF